MEREIAYEEDAVEEAWNKVRWDALMADAKLIEAMAQGIYNADNGIDGDQIGVMIHENFRIEVYGGDKGLPSTLAVCREAARAALSAAKEAGYAIVSETSRDQALVARERAEDSLAAARYALETIAKQCTIGELQIGYGQDFEIDLEGGYDAIIGVARDALDRPARHSRHGPGSAK